jgi:hypothetical protein
MAQINQPIKSVFEGSKMVGIGMTNENPSSSWRVDVTNTSDIRNVKDTFDKLKIWNKNQFGCEDFFYDYMPEGSFQDNLIVTYQDTLLTPDKRSLPTSSEKTLEDTKALMFVVVNYNIKTACVYNVCVAQSNRGRKILEKLHHGLFEYLNRQNRNNANVPLVTDIKHTIINKIWMSIDFRNTFYDGLTNKNLRLGYKEIGIIFVDPVGNKLGRPFLSMEKIIDLITNKFENQEDVNNPFVSTFVREKNDQIIRVKNYVMMNESFKTASLYIDDKFLKSAEEISKKYITHEVGGTIYAFSDPRHPGSIRINPNKIVSVHISRVDPPVNDFLADQVELQQIQNNQSRWCTMNSPAELVEEEKYVISWHTHPEYCYRVAGAPINPPSNIDLNALIYQTSHFKKRVILMVLTREGVYIVKLTDDFHCVFLNMLSASDQQKIMDRVLIMNDFKNYVLDVIPPFTGQGDRTIFPHYLNNDDYEKAIAIYLARFNIIYVDNISEYYKAKIKLFDISFVSHINLQNYNLRKVADLSFKYN